MLGALLIVGTFASAYALVAAILVGWALWIVFRSKRTPPVPALFIWVSVSLTGLNSANHLMPLALGTIVFALFIVTNHAREKWDLHSFFIGMLSGVAMQVYAAVTTWGAVRPPLLSLNASQVAQTGLVFWLVLPELKRKEQWLAWIPGVVWVAVSLSRAPLVAGIVYLFAKPFEMKTKMLAGLLVLVALAAISQGQAQRFLPAPIAKSVEQRTGLIFRPAATTTALLHGGPDELIPNVSRPEFYWTGYGVGNYVTETGLIRPHNLFILIFYQMGALAIVPVFLLGWAVLTRRIPFSVFVALFLLWQFTEEAAGRVVVFFTTAAVFVAVWRTRPPTTSPLKAIRGYLRIARPTTR